MRSGAVGTTGRSRANLPGAAGEGASGRPEHGEAEGAAHAPVARNGEAESTEQGEADAGLTAGKAAPRETEPRAPEGTNGVAEAPRGHSGEAGTGKIAADGGAILRGTGVRDVRSVGTSVPHTAGAGGAREELGTSTAGAS